MQVYPEHRESGAEWLASVPVHWDVKPLKAVAQFINGEAFNPSNWSEDGVPIIRIQNLNGGADYNKFAGDVEKKFHVNANDLLFGWSGNRGTSFGPFIWRGRELHYLNQHIFRVLPQIGKKAWLYWSLKAVTLHVEEKAHGIIGMVHITKGELGAIKIPVPTSFEQSAIAAFLDRETGKIDALVGEQERLIALLKEKRQAAISQAVTKGLDPAVPMKHSGVEWLGEVPAHWQISRAKTLFRRSDLPVHSDAEVVTCFRDGQVTLRRNRREDGFTMAILEIGYQGIRPGQLVLHSMDAFAGAIGVSDSVGKCSPEYLVCEQIGDSAVPRYYGRLLRLMALRGFILAACPSVRERAPRIRFPEFGEMVLPVPSADEQTLITDYIGRLETKLGGLQLEAERAIVLLRERRAALIAAAVTGKIDVREHADIPSTQAA